MLIFIEKKTKFSPIFVQNITLSEQCIKAGGNVRRARNAPISELLLFQNTNIRLI